MARLAGEEPRHRRASNGSVSTRPAPTRKASLTRRPLDEALCFGWIDAVRRGGHATWSIRFTPRKKGSIWSAVNIKRIEGLKAEGRVAPAGLAAYEGRDRDEAEEILLRESRRGSGAGLREALPRRQGRLGWFESMPRSYRHPAVWWVMSAKQEATRERRLATLIANSAAGRKVKHLRRPGDA